MLSQNINIKSDKFILNFLIFTIPVSYISGNLLLNLNTFTLILAVLYFYGKDILKIKLLKIDLLIIFFFSYILIVGLINSFLTPNIPEDQDQYRILKKSILYLRFLLLYFVLRLIIEKKIVSFKSLFFSFGFFSLFVSIDLIYQFIFGVDIFGYEAIGRRLSGPFGDELIAGSFLQRFSFFLLFYIFIFLGLKKRINLNILLFFALILILIGIVLSGNRMPLVLFIMTLAITLIFFIKNLRVPFLLSVFILSLFFWKTLNSNEDFKDHYTGFVKNISQISQYFVSKVRGEEIIISNPHIRVFEHGFLTWEKNKLIGGGIKNFYNNCSSVLRTVENFNGGRFCSSHPHNYYLESLTELGILGLLIKILLFTAIFLKASNFIVRSYDQKIKNLLTPFLIVYIAEIFPIKSSGSLFTTSNSTFLFILIAFIVGLSEYKKL